MSQVNWIQEIAVTPDEFKKILSQSEQIIGHVLFDYFIRLNQVREYDNYVNAPAHTVFPCSPVDALQRLDGEYRGTYRVHINNVIFVTSIEE